MPEANRGSAGAASQQSTAALLARATDQLEDALEHVDLENDPQLADQIIEAIKATDEAATLTTDEVARHRQAEPVAQ